MSQLVCAFCAALSQGPLCSEAIVLIENERSHFQSTRTLNSQSAKQSFTKVPRIKEKGLAHKRDRNKPKEIKVFLHFKWFHRENEKEKPNSGPCSMYLQYTFQPLSNRSLKPQIEIFLNIKGFDVLICHRLALYCRCGAWRQS